MNPLWKINLVSGDEMKSFLKTYYRNTSLLAAYNMINPMIKAALVDIWRQAVLYEFGGVYLDFDVQLSKPLDDFIRSDDTIIFSQERSPDAYSNLYKDNYPLSKTGNISRSIFPLFNTVVQWFIIVEPKNIFTLRTLKHIAHLVELEYQGNSPVIDSMHSSSQMVLYLTTGLCKRGETFFCSCLCFFFNILVKCLQKICSLPHLRFI